MLGLKSDSLFAPSSRSARRISDSKTSISGQSITIEVKLTPDGMLHAFLPSHTLRK